MKKILYVASKVKLHLNLFHVPYLLRLKEEGYEVHVCASNDYGEGESCAIPGCDVFYDIPFHRIPVHPTNLRSFFRLRRILRENHYDIIHCHTPTGAALTRLAVLGKFRKNTKVVYTAHGFHFYKGASPFNWLVYYPAEKMLSRLTDVIITINEEDYQLAKKWTWTDVRFFRGVGIDLNRFTGNDEDVRSILRKELNIPEESILLIFAGEMSWRKHQDFLIRTVALLNSSADVKLVMAGEGAYLKKYRNLAQKLRIDDSIIFLGFRGDVDYLMKASDIYVSSSRQEGLPVNIMEAMATGLPVVCFNIRGNKDLVENGKGGFLVKFDDQEAFVKRLNELASDSELRNRMGLYNKKASKNLERTRLINDMMKIYEELLNNKTGIANEK